MKKLALALALTAAAVTAFAQAPAAAQPAAKITQVEGLVTVTTDNQLVNATLNMPLASEARVMTTVNSKATVEFASGCVANLSGGQSIAANEDACRAFVLAQGSGGAAAGGGIFAGGTGTGLLLVGGGAALLYNVDQNRNNNNTPRPISPS